jgi:hypothetical protein
MKDSRTRSQWREGLLLAVGAAMAGGLLYVMIGGPAGGGLSYPESLGVVVLLGMVWKVAAVLRKRLKEQEPALLEMLPPQPSDRPRARPVPRPSGGSKERLLERAPPELRSLRRLVRLAAARPRSYESRLLPLLTDLARERAQRRGLPAPDLSLDHDEPHKNGNILDRVPLRFPRRRRRERMSALERHVATIEEL